MKMEKLDNMRFVFPTFLSDVVKNLGLNQHFAKFSSLQGVGWCERVAMCVTDVATICFVDMLRTFDTFGWVLV